MKIRSTYRRRLGVIALGLSLAAIAVPNAAASIPWEPTVKSAGVPVQSLCTLGCAFQLADPVRSTAPATLGAIEPITDARHAALLWPRHDRALQPSVPVSPPVAVGSPGAGFDWGDAAIGLGFGAGLVLLTAAAARTARRRVLSA